MPSNKLGFAALFLLAPLGCLGSPDEGPAADPPSFTSADPTRSPCGGKECHPGYAGLYFLNVSGAPRHVLVDGELLCSLAPGAECEAAIDAGDEVIIHVTDESGAAACSGDPRAAVGECACAIFEIHC
jgi:hypothetical protein